LRQLVFHLVSFDVVVQFGNFAERLGGKEPDFPGVRIGDPDEHDGNVLVAVGKNSDRLLIGGRRFPGLPSGRVLIRRKLPTKALSISTFSLPAMSGPCDWRRAALICR
jgi:hypothetical protein